VNALIISNIVLWFVVLAVLVALLAVIRQLGVLHERIAPTGALMLNKGLKVGETAQSRNAGARWASDPTHVRLTHLPRMQILAAGPQIELGV
jgi:hypothetical protein